VFLSWSGEKSRAVALALHDWLPRVINEIEPFMSRKDIAAGALWQLEIASQLESTAFGIVCVTTENQNSRWLNFEAGALAKELGLARVVPLAIDLTDVDVKPPLGQYQVKGISKPEIFDVLQSVNEKCDRPLAEDVLRDSCDQWWERLESKLTEIAASHPPDPSERTDKELLQEILAGLRALQTTAAPPSVGYGYEGLARAIAAVPNPGEALARAIAALPDRAREERQARADRIGKLLYPLLPEASQLYFPPNPSDSVLVVTEGALPEQIRNAVLEVSGAGRFPVDFVETSSDTALGRSFRQRLGSHRRASPSEDPVVTRLCAGMLKPLDRR
jgi:hypothetical protein